MIHEPRQRVWEIIARADASDSGNTTQEMVDLIAEYIYCVHGVELEPELPKTKAEASLLIQAYAESITFFTNYQY
jgi:hypothetical protein